MNTHNALRRKAIILTFLTLSLLTFWLPFASSAGVAYADDGLCQPGICLPDLVMTNNGSTYVNGQWYAEFTIRNIGNARAGTFHVDLLGGSGATIATFTVGGLGAGLRTDVHYPISDCEYVGFTLVTDSTRVVHESNESNNVASNLGNVC